MTRTLDYVLADVFTSQAFSGNQLAVFPKVSGLAPETMQAIVDVLYAVLNPRIRLSG